MKISFKMACVAVAAAAVVDAGAVPISVSGSLGGQSVNANGTLTAGAGSVTVVLNNLQADPTSIIQCISGLSFDVTGATGSGALSSVNLGESINIAPGGVYTVNNLADPLTRWTASETGTHVVALTTLSGGSPSLLIVGPPNGSNLYGHANPSITGDNPSVLETATFTVTIPGVTATSTFANATFFFGTSGEPVGGNVPDGGTTMALLGLALLGVETLRRKFAAA